MKMLTNKSINFDVLPRLHLAITE